MMFTQGVRKIFSHPDCIQRMPDVQKAAEAAGYTALSFNAIIYVFDGSEWFESCFRMTDFMAVLE